MTFSGRLAIDSATSSLLVYDTESFWYFQIDKLINLSPSSMEDQDGDTKVVVKQGMDDDVIRFYTNDIMQFHFIGNRLQRPISSNKNFHAI